MDYLRPGILLITVAPGIAHTAYRLLTEVSDAIFERFQSMPIGRWGMLWGHVLASLVASLISLALVIIVAVAMGFSSGTGILAWLGVVGILALLSWGKVIVLVGAMISVARGAPPGPRRGLSPPT